VVTPFYTEDKVSCYPYPINVDYATNRVKPVPDVMPSMQIDVEKEGKTSVEEKTSVGG